MSFPYAPQVVAKSSFTDQTASLSATTVFAPTEAGDYQVAVYITQSTSATVQNFGSILWTDEYTVGSWPFETNPAPGVLTATIHVAANTPIQVQVNAASGSAYPYDLFVTVVQL